MDTEDAQNSGERDPAMVALSQSMASRVLAIPEVLDAVMSFSTVAECGRCIRVCKTWMDMCISHTWHTLDEIYVLFQIMAPTRTLHFRTRHADSDGSESEDSEDERDKWETNEAEEFCRTLSFEDWDKIEQYTSRIACLVVNGATQTIEPILSDAALLDISLSKPGGKDYFPRLRSLKIALLRKPSLIRFSSIFLNNHLLNLEIYFVGDAEACDRILSFVNDASRIAPNLRSLVLNQGGSTEGYDPTCVAPRLATSVAKWGCLRSIKLCACAMPLLAPLASSSTLEVIDMDTVLTPKSPRYSPILKQPQSIHGPRPFEILRKLDFRGPQEAFFSIFVYGSTFNSLSILNINMHSVDDAASFHACLSQLFHTCPLLAEITFTMYDETPIVHTLPACSWSEALQIICSFMNLEYFRLEHHHPISLRDDELMNILVSCPSLRRLHLNPEPLSQGPTDLSIFIIPLMARYYPLVEELSLYVTTSDVFKHGPISYHFPCLKSLCFGTSSLKTKHEGDILVLLGQVLPFGCELICEAFRPWSHLSGLPDIDNRRESHSKRRKTWASVKEKVPHMLRLRSFLFAGHRCQPAPNQVDVDSNK